MDGIQRFSSTSSMFQAFQPQAPAGEKPNLVPTGDGVDADGGATLILVAAGGYFLGKVVEEVFAGTAVDTAAKSAGNLVKMAVGLGDGTDPGDGKQPTDGKSGQSSGAGGNTGASGAGGGGGASGAGGSSGGGAQGTSG